MLGVGATWLEGGSGASGQLLGHLGLLLREPQLTLNEEDHIFNSTKISKLYCSANFCTMKTQDIAPGQHI